MPKKLSYMNKNNLLNEGLLDAILDLLKKHKIKKLRKKFKDQPEIRSSVDRLNQYATELEDRLKRMGVEPDEIYRIK